MHRFVFISALVAMQGVLLGACSGGDSTDGSGGDTGDASVAGGADSDAGVNGDTQRQPADSVGDGGSEVDSGADTPTDTASPVDTHASGDTGATEDPGIEDTGTGVAVDTQGGTASDADTVADTGTGTPAATDTGGDTGSGVETEPVDSATGADCYASLGLTPPYSEEDMMRFVPCHEQHFVTWTWDTPQNWIEIRKSSNGGVFTQEEIDILANAAPVVSINNNEQTERFAEQYPDVLYRTGYLNLEKDTQRCGETVDTLEHPEYYLYNPDGTIVAGGVEGNECPWFNLANPDMREWWLNEAARQIAGNEYKGRFFFIDALAKVGVIDGSDKVDYWGNPVGEGYWDHAHALLTEFRNRFADKVLIVGNFARPGTGDLRTEFTMKYTHIAYLEHFENFGNYVETAHEAIALMQELAAAGKRVFVTVNAYNKPTPMPDLTLEEKRAKAAAAMPDLWAEYTETERDELAEIYAYFPFKLAMFLIGAGEKAHLKYTGSKVVRTAGRDLFKAVMPFPEWDMPLGAPLEPPQRNGDVYTRRFEHVQVVLDLANGTSEFIPLD